MLPRIADSPLVGRWRVAPSSATTGPLGPCPRTSSVSFRSGAVRACQQSLENGWNPPSSGSQAARPRLRPVKERKDGAGPWHSRTQGSILGGMGATEAAPRGSDQPGAREAGGTDSETAEQIRAFLIADIRGYTVFTQDRGDEGAARLAAKFAGIVRQQVEDRDEIGRAHV